MSDHGYVQPSQAGQSRSPVDVISAEPRQIPSRAVGAAGVVLLAVALAVGVMVVVHGHHRDAAASRGRLHPAATFGRPRAASAAMSVVTARLPRSAGPPAGTVTVFAVHAAPGLAEVSVTARITGARPRVGYELSGGDCATGAAGRGPADWVWAVGTTNARGSGSLTGHVWTVSVGREYYLVLGPVSGYQDRPGPAVSGFLATAHGLTAVPAGIAPCAP
jgi:hypothetical protein